MLQLILHLIVVIVILTLGFLAPKPAIAVVQDA